MSSCGQRSRHHRPSRQRWSQVRAPGHHEGHGVVGVVGPVAPPGRDPGLVARRPGAGVWDPEPGRARDALPPSPRLARQPRERGRPAAAAPARAGERRPLSPREVLGPLGQREPGPPNRPRVASRFQPSQRLPHTGRLGARLRGLAETIAGPPSTPAPRSLSGPAPGPPRARCLAWRRRPLGGRSSLGRENKPTRVVAPPLGWRLHRGVSPHEPPKSL